MFQKYKNCFVTLRRFFANCNVMHSQFINSMLSEFVRVGLRTQRQHNKSLTHANISIFFLHSTRDLRLLLFSCFVRKVNSCAAVCHRIVSCSYHLSCYQIIVSSFRHLIRYACYVHSLLFLFRMFYEPRMLWCCWCAYLLVNCIRV